jgi:16S rRNA G527 N7-methylase RsmG
MYLVPQGQNPIALIAALEKRVIFLENALKRLESEPKPKMGRPPKVKDEPNQPESRDSVSN